jgi:hypothetical protein
VVSRVLCTLALFAPAVTASALGIAPVWGFAAMLAWVLYMVARYVENEYSLYLLQAGLLVVIGFFIDASIAVYAIVLSIDLFALYAARQRSRGVSVVLVLLFPVLFAALSWAALEWVFTGHPWAPLPPAGTREIVTAYPTAAAYVVAVIAIALSPRATRRRYHIAVFMTWPIAIGVMWLLGRETSAGEALLIGTACTLAAITQIANVWLRRFASLALCVSAFALSATLSPIPIQTIALLPLPPLAQVQYVHPAWLEYVDPVRWGLCVLAAGAVVLLVRHSLRRLTGTIV